MNNRHLRPLALPALLLLAATACTAKAEPAATTPPAPVKHTVKFEAFVPDGERTPDAGSVVGYEMANATYVIGDHTGTEQDDATLPITNKAGSEGLTRTYTGSGTVSLIVQNKTDSGAVACRITVDGAIQAVKSASTDYGVAVCKASY